MESAKQDLFVPIINQRILNASNPGCEKPDDFLQWMLDLADNDRDLEPDFLAHNLFIIMSLAVAETSTMALTQALFDLVVYPECVGPLREEIRSTFKNGWRGITVQELAALRLMDSFMRESQRLNPASEGTSRFLSLPVQPYYYPRSYPRAWF